MILPIRDNKLDTFQEAMTSFVQMIEPVEKYFDKDNTQFSYGHTGSRTWSRTASLEGLLRPLWGLVPATAGGLDTTLWANYEQAIQYGTDPKSETYWGGIGESDQRMVEMATLGLALAMTPEKLWEPLSEAVRENFANWLNQINAHTLPNNNWRFFIVMVNVGLKNVGAKYDSIRMEKELEVLESFYLADGWYADGAEEQRDYYVPFAMHYYGLIYSKLMNEDDPERCERFRVRGKRFAEDFIYWFGSNGDALPYGRSLTYRFAQCAYWGAMAFADVEVFSWGVMKGIVLRHLRHWFGQNIFDSEGILSLGYNYENLLMTEGYNAPGSTYWAMKAYIILALKEDHPFWQAKELPLPQLKEQVVQEHPHMILCRENPEHFAAFTSGQYAGFEPAHMDAKYEKFVYSNIFGFSVPKGTYGIEQGAYDNVLALSEQDMYFRTRHQSTILQLDEDMIVSSWTPWEDVAIQTWLIAGLPWHIRIHCINTKRPLHLAEGGYAISREDTNAMHNAILTQNSKHDLMIHFDHKGNACSGIIDLLGRGEAHRVQPEANTNLCQPRTFIPTIAWAIEQGIHWMITAVYGSNNHDLPETKPELISGDGAKDLKIIFGNKCIRVNMETEEVTVICEGE